MERVFYRLITPPTFSNLDFDTLDGAKTKLISYGSKPESEHYQYWQNIKKQCKIVKVTEIIEELNYA